MKKVNIIGQFFGENGYASHTRQLIGGLVSTGIECSFTGSKPADWLRQVKDYELQVLERNPDDADINLMIGIPPHWNAWLPENKPFIGYLVWEGEYIPEYWLDTLLDERVKQIWVPSKHVKDAIINTMDGERESDQLPNWYCKLRNKIKIVPHGVDKVIFNPKDKDVGKFTFLMNKGWPSGMKDRGGISHGIKAFCEEFTSKDNVRLIVKINAAYGMTEQLMNQHIAELNIKNKDKPDVKIIIQNIEFKDLVNLYNSADVFVNTSHADGFNLNCLEAQACGVPVLTTTFGGQADFCSEDTGWLLSEGTKYEVKWDVNYEGNFWEEPNVDEIKRKMRYIFKNKKEVLEKGRAALKNSNKYTWYESAKKAKDCLLNI